MPYGTIKVDTITFTDGGVDKSVAISGLVQNPTFSGNITATGTISGNIIQGGTTVSGLTVTGTTANFASGVFTTQISGSIVKVPAGTAGAPSLQVGTGTSVAPGLYGAGTDQIGISTGGSSVVVLDSVGQLRVVNTGTAAAPAVIVGNDLNSGLYSPGADQVAISTGGTARFNVDTGGDINIATANGLLWALNKTTNYLRLYNTGSNGVDLSSNTTLSFLTAGSERLRIDSTGKVGIATSSPYRTQTIRGTGELLQFDLNSITDGTYAAITWNAGNVDLGSSAQSAEIRGYREGGTAWGALSFHTRDNSNTSKERARIDSSGRLLVGTSTSTNNIRFNQSFAVVSAGNPTYGGASLTNYGGVTNTASPVLDLNRSRGTTDGSMTKVESGDRLGAIGFRGADGSAFLDGAAIEAYADGATSANDLPTRLVFSTTADGAASFTERMRIDSSGRMLLGSTSASGSARLIVKGASGDLTGEGRIHVSAGTATPADGTNLGRLIFSDQNDGSWGGTIAFARDGGTWTTGASHPTRMVISTATNGSASPTERMRITSDGKVGIGTTGPSTALHVVQSSGNGEIALDSPAATSILSLLSNATGTSVLGYSQQLRIGSVTGTGAAGLTERVRIDSSGRLLVGTSTARSNIGGVTPYVQFEGANTSLARIISLVYGEASASPPVFAFNKHRGTSVGQTTSVASGDGLGRINFHGADDTNFVVGASILAEVDGTPGANDMPGRLVFSTTADGAASPTERMRIDSTGRVSAYLGISAGTTAQDRLPLTLSSIGAAYSTGAGTGDLLYSPASTVIAINNTTPTTGVGALINFSTTSSVGVCGAYFGAVDGSAINGSAHLVFGRRTAAQSWTETARIDSSGRLLVGTSTARSNFFGSTTLYSPGFQLEGATDQNRILSVVGSNSGGAGGVLVLASQKSGAVGGNTIVTNNGQLGLVSFQGSDGTEFVEAARIQAEVDGTPGANDMPGRLVFSTTADGAATPTEAMRINNQRELLIGTTTRTANGGVLQVSNGITFPGTQSACSDPNTLDDYEEGTWTVTLYDAATAGNASATTATGDYTKFGNTVRATFSIDNINTTGLTAGNLLTFTLPFTHAGTYESAGSCAFASVTLGAGYTGLTSFINGNATRGYFLAWGNNIAFGNAPVSYFNNGAADLRVTITYKAA